MLHIPATAKAVILDIEGTITTISFVHDVMFPYVRNNVQQYLTTTWDTPTTQQDVQDLISQSNEDQHNGIENITFITGSLGSTEKDVLVPQIVANVLSQMDIDRKIAPLKNLQGHMWKDAFEQGVIKSTLFDDVYDAIDRWNQQGKKVVIYSSGSVFAQRLLIGHTERGSLIDSFTAFFDTVNAGHKREAASYTTIAKELGFEANQCVFISDVYEEVAACGEAGMHGIIVIRPGNTAIIPDANEYPVVNDFNSVFPWMV